MNHSIRVVDDAGLAQLTAQAAASPRLRSNGNLHGSPQDAVQRLCNAFEPGTYVPVHRHTSSGGFELFAALRGRIVLLAFDDHGVVTERVEMGDAGPVRVAEIAAGSWHALASLVPGTVMLEVKAGPYLAGHGVEYAPWSPAEADPHCHVHAAWYRRAAIGDRVPD